jgi:predicted Zn-dependent protease
MRMALVLALGRVLKMRPAPWSTLAAGLVAGSIAFAQQSTSPAAAPVQTGVSAAAQKSTPVPGAIFAPDPLPGKDFNSHIKRGSEQDVTAVGKRRIGVRGIKNWYSTNWEIQIGRRYATEIDATAPMVTDPMVVGYVNRIGQTLVRNSDARIPFTIKVLNSEAINAMALPGGYLYVDSGLILACDSEDELAGVMAHEIAHVTAHHAAREMTKMDYMAVGSIPMMLLGQGLWAGYGVYQGTQLAMPVGLLEFSRRHEAEADYLGVQYMYQAGYDPQGMVAIFEKFDALEKQRKSAIPLAFRTHPATAERIRAVQREMATILPPRPKYLVTTAEFEQVKAWLQRVQSIRSAKDRAAASGVHAAVGRNNP